VNRTRKATLIIAVLLLPACAAGPKRATDASVGRTPTVATPDAAELAERGRIAASRGDSVRAEQYLALAIERGADQRELLPLLLSVCVSSSRMRAALDHAAPYLEQHPEDDSLRYLIATIHVALGQTEEARASLELLLHRDPQSPEAHYLLGVLDAQDAPETAREHFRAYLDVAPRGRHAAEVRSRLSELLVREQRLARREVAAPPQPLAESALPGANPSSVGHAVTEQPEPSGVRSANVPQEVLP
jgi:tetratricopeptide (TPR) repeat protein